MKLLLALLSLFLVGVAASVLVVGMLIWSSPDFHQLENCFKTSMFKVYLCADSPQYVRLKNISPYVRQAVIAAEDAAFYSHEGLDWHELKASLKTNLQHGGFRRGGSTLTQQLAKNAFLSKEKSLWRKLKEAYLARAIERAYDKDFILEKYLNLVEFGPNIYGIKSAAKHYFNKSPDQLHPLEAVFLAFLLPNPKAYSKSFSTGRPTAFAQKKMSIILNRMLVFGKLSQPAYQAALAHLNDFPWANLQEGDFRDAPNQIQNPDITLNPELEIELDEGDQSLIEDPIDEDYGP